jgi:ribosome biogenesis GTPase
VLVDAADEPTVVAVLPRSSAFVRGDPMEGAATEEQVIAADIDTVFVVHGLTNGPNIRRLERELVLVYDSGATPVVVLTKADLVDPAQADDAVTAVSEVAPGLDVHVTDAMTGAGIDELRAYAEGGRTVALIGASGVGKSTIVNRLAGGEVQEISLWDADEGFSRAFADIEELAVDCRFRDCAHGNEPGCAVRAAVERGELSADRLDHYLRLDRELDDVARRNDGRIASRALRQYYKNR